MITHHCSECGNEVEEYCPDHPSATVESIYTGPSNRIENMTPDEAWNGYVGSQSTREFVAFAGRAASKAVRDYTCDSPLCADLTDEERTTLASRLLDHIAANG